MRYVILGLSLTLLAACGNQLPSESLDREGAASLKDIALESDAYLIDMLANPGDFNLQAVGEVSVPEVLLNILETSGVDPQQGADCFEDKNASEDRDNDGVPLMASYEIDCTLTGVNSSNISLKGTINLSDKDDNDSTSGYTGRIDNYTLGARTRQGDEGSLNLDLSIDVTANNPNYSVDYSVSLSGSGADGNGSIAYAYDAGYAPDNAEDPFAAGTFNYDGSLIFEGEDARYQLDALTTDLHYSETCTKGFDGGSKLYEDSENRRLEITYTGCVAASTSFEGSSL